MLRIRSLDFVVAGCVCLAITATAVGANERHRVSVFRDLTNEAPKTKESLKEPRLLSQSAATPPVAKVPPVAQRPVVTQATYTQPVNSAPAARPTGFYAGSSAQATMNQFPRRSTAQVSASKSMKLPAKPFTRVQGEPTVSPWLIMDQDQDDSQPIPNYLTLIRPQLNQIQTNHTQQRELWNLQGQFQTFSVAPTPPQYPARAPGMTSSARYMNTAQFYGGRR